MKDGILWAKIVSNNALLAILTIKWKEFASYVNIHVQAAIKLLTIVLAAPLAFYQNKKEPAL